MTSATIRSIFVWAPVCSCIQTYMHISRKHLFYSPWLLFEGADYWVFDYRDRDADVWKGYRLRMDVLSELKWWLHQCLSGKTCIWNLNLTTALAHCLTLKNCLCDFFARLVLLLFAGVKAKFRDCRVCSSPITQKTLLLFLNEYLSPHKNFSVGQEFLLENLVAKNADHF